jgi:hypothetical protein
VALEVGKDVEENPLQVRALESGTALLSDNDSSGISASYVGTFVHPETGETFKGIFKPEDGAVWTAADMQRNAGEEPDDFDSDAVRQDIVDNNDWTAEARAEWNGKADDYVHEVQATIASREMQELWVEIAEDHGLTLLGDPVYGQSTYDHTVTRLGYSSNDPEDARVAAAATQEAVGAVLGQMFDTRGYLKPETYVRTAMRDAVEAIKRDGGTTFVALPYYDSRDIRDASHYFSLNDDGVGFDEWMNDHGNQWKDDRIESAVEARRNSWQENNPDLSENYIRDGITNRDFPHHERDRAAFEVDRLLGLGMTPYTAIRQEAGGHHSPGSVQAWAKVEEAGSLDDLTTSSGGRTQILQAALFDIIVGNTDRHDQNYIADTATQRVVTIDNNLTFTEHSQLRSAFVSVIARTPSLDWTLPEPVMRRLAARMDRADWKSWADKYEMSEGERNAFFDRLHTARSLVNHPAALYQFAQTRGQWFGVPQFKSRRRMGWS